MQDLDRLLRKVQCASVERHDCSSAVEALQAVKDFFLGEAARIRKEAYEDGRSVGQVEGAQQERAARTERFER